jgi:hypothetical protein
MYPTFTLAFKGGKLHQLFMDAAGNREWRLVPSIDELV